MADTDIDFDSDLSAASPKKQKKTCNYCHMTTKLLPNKPFCKRCADNSYKICIRCKLPYNSDKYFEKSLKRCNSCHEKYLKEKSRREQKKKALEIIHSDDNDDEAQAKKCKKEESVEDSSKIIVKNRGKRYLVFYETDNPQE